MAASAAHSGGMISTVFLLMSQPLGRNSAIRVVCAICGDVEGLQSSACEVASLTDLYSDLLAAGALESELQTPLHVIRCGFPVFLEVGASVARNLGLLAKGAASAEWSGHDAFRKPSLSKSAKADVA